MDDSLQGSGTNIDDFFFVIGTLRVLYRDLSDSLLEYHIAKMEEAEVDGPGKNTPPFTTKVLRYEIQAPEAIPLDANTILEWHKLSKAFQRLLGKSYLNILHVASFSRAYLAAPNTAMRRCHTDVVGTVLSLSYVPRQGKARQGKARQGKAKACLTLTNGIQQ